MLFRTERDVARMLIRSLIDRGCYVSVFDGEFWTVLRSRNETAIMCGLKAVDVETILARDRNGLVGKFSLAWGRSNDSSDLIADFTNNTACVEVWESVVAKCL